MKRIAKLTGVAGLCLMLLAACGNDADPEPTATVAPTVTSEPTGTTAAVSTPLPATPLTSLQPGATPNPSPAASPLASPAATLVAAIPDGMVQIQGTLALNGKQNVDYVLTDQGCVGLGAYGALSAGRQIVVRDEHNTIIGVGVLEATEHESACEWSFDVTVDASEWYLVQIPMTVEYVFSAGEVQASGGQVQIRIP